MQSSNIPDKLPIPFANAAGGSYIRPIPTASQIGIQDGAASLTDGFPPLNATPVGAGGVPPFMQDHNGILFAVSGWSRWVAAGGPVYFDAVFSTAIGGYPKGAIVQSATTPGVMFLSTAENNTNNPDSVLTGWVSLIPVKASGAEIITGIDDAKFITPLGLAGLRASSAEILAGTNPVKYLTPAEFFASRASSGDIGAGTDDHKYITPAGLTAAFTGNLSASGWYTFPGGFRLCWKPQTANSGATAFTWPIAFGTACFGGWCDGGDSLGNDQDNNPIIKTFNAAGGTLNSARDSAVSVMIYGIGV